MMITRVLAVLVCLALVGCADASVIDGNADGVWLKPPLVGGGGADGVAARHCARFGKTAVYQSTLRPEPNRNYFRPIRAYNCT